MSELTPDEIRAAVHPIDDAVVAEIIATGVNHDELVEACHFFAKERKSKTTHDVPEAGSAGWCPSWSGSGRR